MAIPAARHHDAVAVDFFRAWAGKKIDCHFSPGGNWLVRAELDAVLSDVDGAGREADLGDIFRNRNGLENPRGI